MVGRHPVCVLFLDMPNDEVDVNVHPTKREVRLQNSWRVLERLERGISHTLLSVPTGAPASENFPLGSVGAIKTIPKRIQLKLTSLLGLRQQPQFKLDSINHFLQI